MDHALVFTTAEREAVIAAALNRPDRNLTGLIGPQCPACSGLGAVLRLGTEGAITRSTTRCTCEGSGIDLVALERHSHAALWARVHALESALLLPLTSINSRPITMSRQYWSELITWAVADGTPVANTVTETIIMPNVTIPANYMQDGRAMRIKAAGKYSTLGSGTVSHIWNVRWGGVSGTVITKTGTVTLLISMANAYWDLEVMLQTRSNGSAGTVLGDGLVREFGGTAPTIGSATGAPAVAPLTAGGQTAPAAVTLDLTADTALSLTITHGAANASNTATGQHYTIESLN